MAITAFKTFINGEVLLASDLNSSLGTIIDEVNVHGGEIDTLNGSTQGRSRNLIINGDFSVWQRGTSQTTAGYGSADRWYINQSGATHTSDQQAFTLGQTDVPGNPEFFLRHDVTTGNDNTHVQHRIENVELTADREVTLSFYAKGVNPGGGSVTVEHTQYFGTGGSPSSSVTTEVTTSLTLTASWQRFTYTFTPPSVSGKTLGTNGDDSIWIRIGQGSDTATDAWNIDISNVQLEFGDTATEFEYINPADQLARCQRYYQKSYSLEIAPGSNTDTGLANALQLPTNNTRLVITSGGLKVRMRATPTITTWSQDGTSANVSEYDASTTKIAISSIPGPSDCNVGRYLQLGGASINEFYVFHWAADAEL